MNFTRYYFLLIFHVLLLKVSTSCTIYSQSDTIWLKYQANSLEYEICKKESHEAFRLIKYIPENKYIVKDFYKSGVLKRTGFSEVADDLHFVGDVKHYTTEGRLYKISTYFSHSKGVNIYLTKDSLKTSKRVFTNNCETGETEFYDMAGKIISRPIFKDGNPYDGLIPEPLTIFIDSFKYSYIKYKEGSIVGYQRYFKNGIKACETYYKNKMELDSALYYYPDGIKIGKCIYSPNNLPMEGEHVDFYVYFGNTKNINFHPNTNFSFSDARIRSISKFKQGKIIERISFDHLGNKIGECTYDDGHPINGAVMERNELKFYENQHYYYTRAMVYDDKMEKVVYDYLTDNGKKYGKTNFYQPDTVYTGVFEKDKPLNGIVFYKNELCQYHEGQKVGWCKVFNDEWKVVEQFTYSENRKNGNYFSIYFSGLDSLRGNYLNDEPYSGSFIINKVNPEVHVFLNGTVDLKLKYNRNYELVSKEEINSGLIVFFKASGDTLCTGYLQDSKPFNGTFWDQFKLTKTNFENGLLNGGKEYLDGNNSILKVENYVNDQIQDVDSFLNGVKYQCKYKDGYPFNGYIIDDINKMVKYLDGKIVP